MAKYFVVGHYQDGAHTPVHLEPKTLQDARQSLRWQNSGVAWNGAIYVPKAGSRGTMRLVEGFRSTDENAEEIEVSGMGWVTDAWAKFVENNWPPLPLDGAREAIAAAGFDVYMRNESDTWLYFTDGHNIGYLQVERLHGPYSLSTVHKPNIKSGTGYGVEQGLSLGDLTRDKLVTAFTFAPSWASPESHASSKKWKSFTEFQERDTYSKGYKLVNEAAK